MLNKHPRIALGVACASSAMLVVGGVIYVLNGQARNLVPIGIVLVACWLIIGISARFRINR